MAEEQQPSLGQLIWLVRRELEWAYEADADQPLRFEVGPVELDLTVEATRTTTGGGGLDLKVVSGNLSRESAKGTTSNVHVTLTPVDTRTGSRKYQISARDTEPPPRRAEAMDEAPAGSVRLPEPDVADGGQTWTARDTESLPPEPHQSHHA
jgi:Trypsin-co-occurring domain 2